jgi:DNA-binding LytR/AlgR family response regulator
MENNTKQSNSLSRKNIHVGAWSRYSAAEIMLFEADVNYTVIYFANGRKMTVATSMKILEKRFADTDNFFRTHKSFLVNLDFIKAYDKKHGDESVQMQNDFRVAVSRRKRVAFAKKLKTINN